MEIIKSNAYQRNPLTVLLAILRIHAILIESVIGKCVKNRIYTIMWRVCCTLTYTKFSACELSSSFSLNFTGIIFVKCPETSSLITRVLNQLRSF